MINIVEDWGISTENYTRQDDCNNNDISIQNSCIFNKNIENGQTLYLPGSSDSYPFDLISIKDVDNVEFYGDSDTVIKFSANGHTHLEIKDADNFNIHDLNFDGRDAIYEGGVWAKDGAKNGTLKNVRVYDAYGKSIVIGGIDYESPPKTYNITVEDCEVHGQQFWGDSTTATAMFIAGGGADNITFLRCTTDVKSHYNNPASPADHFGFDDATSVEFRDCTATGNGSQRGPGFWGEGANQANAELHNCTASETAGGLAASEKSTAKAHDCYFYKCSRDGWSAWSQGGDANLKMYDSTFDHCFNADGYPGGGIHFSGGDGHIENCTFINTQSGYNVTFYAYSEEGTPTDATITLKESTFDASLRSFDVGVGADTINAKWNTFSQNYHYITSSDYTWNIWRLGKTTAINTPTSDTTVGVHYNGHTTDVEYTGYQTLTSIAFEMRDAINDDPNAAITAEI